MRRCIASLLLTRRRRLRRVWGQRALLHSTKAHATLKQRQVRSTQSADASRTGRARHRRPAGLLL